MPANSHDDMPLQDAAIKIEEGFKAWVTKDHSVALYQQLICVGCPRPRLCGQRTGEARERQAAGGCSLLWHARLLYYGTPENRPSSRLLAKYCSSERAMPSATPLVKYLNRPSDLLFVMARGLNRGGAEPQ